jgi:thymidine phosphorylase
MSSPFRILERKRAGLALTAGEIGALVRGAADGSWSDAQLAAFLMAAAIRGLDPAETDALTRAMLESGDRWRLAEAVPGVVDKHSTGGVGDKVSLVLGPLLASCGVPVVMLTGRGLGHTGGTADKLESIPGLRQELDRERSIELLERCGLAIGVATAAIAPADRRLYALRDQTATIESIPLITASILSKKLAAGAGAVVFDVKSGNGAFLPELDRARELARGLVATAEALGTPARALVTDMSQPLGVWAGHAAEVAEALRCLAGEGPEDLTAVTLALAVEMAEMVGRPLGRPELERALADGRAHEAFLRWAGLQGADPAWLRAPRLDLAPVVVAVRAGRSGVLARVDTRQLGLLLAEAGGGRVRPGEDIDRGVALETLVRLGQPVAAGDELARLHLRFDSEGAAARFGACFEIADEGSGALQAPPLFLDRIAPVAPVAPGPPRPPGESGGAPPRHPEL